MLMSMSAMQLQERDKGDISKIRSFNSLLGRWFKKESKSASVKKEGDESSSSCICRGSIVSLTENSYFIVLCVFKQNGKKWHPSTNANPSWPLTKNDIGKYNVLIVRMKFSKCKNCVTYIPYKDIVDGVNIHSTYKIVGVASITRYHFKVDI